MELPNRDQLDKEAAAALSQLTERQKQEALRLLGNPPNIRNIPPSKWQEWKEETEAALAIILILCFSESAIYHGGTEEESRKQARVWAESQSATLARQITETTYTQLEAISNRLSESTEPVPRKELLDALNRVFGPERTERIAVDAVTRGQSVGGEWSIAEFVGKSLDDWWQNNPGMSQSGPCKTCMALHGQPRTVWELEHPSGPPAHPGCVCEIRYVNLDNAGNN